MFPQSELIVDSVGRDLDVTALLSQIISADRSIDRDPYERKKWLLLKVLQVNEGLHERILKTFVLVVYDVARRTSDLPRICTEVIRSLRSRVA
jgi:hypothetical protein